MAQIPTLPVPLCDTIHQCTNQCFLPEEAGGGGGGGHTLGIRQPKQSLPSLTDDFGTGVGP